MPSRKVAAAAAGKTARPLVMSAVRNNVRQGIVPSDSELARVQEDIRIQNEQLLADTPFRNGTIKEVEFDGTNEVQIQHDLGGPAKGFIVVNLLAGTGQPVSIVQVPGSGTGAGRDDTHITLFAIDGCHATLWIWR